MSTKFAEALSRENNFTTTENGAVALKSTGSSLVDLFGQIGALRPRSEFEIEKMFSKAFAEDKLLATKMLFYARDIRFGGLGERRTFRVILKSLAKVHPDVVKKNIYLIPYFGRWDDIFVLFDTPCEKDMLYLIANQWNADIDAMDEGKPISLLAKWMPSCNTSSRHTRSLAKRIMTIFEIPEKNYRQTLSGMREYIKVTERFMSANEWGKIEYSQVPSKAMNNYRNAFYRRDSERFEAYIESLKKGKTKINASTLFPYDIVEKIMYNREYNDVLEEQWKALPNYIEGEHNVLVMADVSGSMTGRPMATSVGLAIYFAERNKGAYKDLFMTFSHRPELVRVKGSTLYEKVWNARNANWDMNTDFEKALDMILTVAIKNNLSQDELPKALVVISDMQFDSARGYGRDSNWTFFEAMEQKYASYGYQIPNIIFWNVESRRDTFQVHSEYKGVQLASGQSPSVFKSILANIGKTPYEAMIETLSNPVYDAITV